MSNARAVTVEECPDPSVHGNPFRYCPYCTWMEPQPQNSPQGGLAARLRGAAASGGYPYIAADLNEAADALDRQAEVSP